MFGFIHRNRILLLLLLLLRTGGIHLWVTGFRFPSATEQKLWRACSYVIMVTVSAFLALAWVGSKISRLWFGYGGAWTDVWDTFYKMPLWALFVLYIYAGSFVVIESGISLREAPIGVFYTPGWVQLLLHV